MPHHVEILITADVPDKQHDLGHEGIVAAKENTLAIVQVLEGIGLTNVQQTRIVRRTRAPLTPPIVDTSAVKPNTVLKQEVK